MTKELHIAIDIHTDIVVNDFYNEQQLGDMMIYCRSLGATTIAWIFDDMWSLYDAYPGGMDLLRTAIEAAHTNDLKFHIVYKPFEGNWDHGFHTLLPHTAPRPTAVPVWEDLRGLTPIIRPFIVEHPEMCLQRKVGDEDPGGTVSVVRLIKNDDTPSGLRAEDLSVWVSEVNGKFTKYSGTFSLEERSEWRPIYPLGKICRILTLSSLNIPEKFRYIEVRLAEGALADKTFCNDYNQIIELVDSQENVIPTTPAISTHGARWTPQKLSKPNMAVRYALDPAARAFFNDAAAIDEAAAGMRNYGYYPYKRIYPLEEMRSLAVARGKMQYKSGTLNPVYPEVRQHWLDEVQYCIDRGADAVDFRPLHHGQIQEYWLYGYNPPVVAKLGEDAPFAEVQQFISEAYTEFLREARKLLHSQGRQIGVHLFPNFLNIGDRKSPYPHMFRDYQWQTWIREIADFAVFRGAMGLDKETLHYAVDRFGISCSKAQIPLIYQSNRRSYGGGSNPLHFSPDRLRWLEYERDYVINHPNLSAYELYETASFTCLDKNGRFWGSEEMRKFSPKGNKK